MRTSNAVTNEINLSGTPENDRTRELFSVAARTGDAKILSEMDALSYAMYQDQYESCGEGSSAQVEICRQRVSRFGSYPRSLDQDEDCGEGSSAQVKACKQRASRNKDSYSIREVIQKLNQLPEDKQQSIWKRAGAFMSNAETLLKELR